MAPYAKPILQPGKGNMPRLILSAPDGGRAEIYLHGAQLTSWIPAGGSEVLFLSPKADFLPGVAIRGGVPVIFPQFAGLGPLPKHGFARTSAWEPLATGPEQASLRLRENENTLALWPYKFELEYTVRIGGGQLEMTLKVVNTDITPFDFTAAMHTYLRIADLHLASVWGLQGLWLTDTANGNREAIQKDEWVDFPGEVDRVYSKALKPLHLMQEEQKTRIEQAGFPDAVVWNPGPEKAAALKDLEPNNYLEFVCVEAAVAEKPVRLAPGKSWTGSQKITV